MAADLCVTTSRTRIGRSQPGVLIWVVLAIALSAVYGCHASVVEGDRAWHALVDPYRRTVNLGSYNLHYIDMGSGEPVVLVHGFADSTFTWHKNVSALLANGLRIIMVDQPGLGRSDMPPQPYAYSIENQADAVLRLADALGLTRFNLMGHSMGGGIVLYIALKEPERVKTAVVVDPACFRPPRRLSMTYPLVKYLAPLLAGRWSVRLALKDVYCDDDKVDAVLVEEYFQPMQREGYWAVLAALQKEYFSPAFDQMTSRYGAFRAPLLIIWGEQDRWLPISYGSDLRAQIPEARFSTLADCGHNPHQECWEAFNRDVDAFYDQQLGLDALRRIPEHLSKVPGRTGRERDE